MNEYASLKVNFSNFCSALKSKPYLLVFPKFVLLNAVPCALGLPPSKIVAISSFVSL